MAKIAPLQLSATVGSEIVPHHDASEPSNDTSIASAKDEPSDATPNDKLTVGSVLKNLAEDAADLVEDAVELAAEVKVSVDEVADQLDEDSGHFGWLEDYDSVQ